MQSTGGYGSLITLILLSKYYNFSNLKMITFYLEIKSGGPAIYTGWSSIKPEPLSVFVGEIDIFRQIYEKLFVQTFSGAAFR